MTELADDAAPPAPAAWWRRLWAHPGFHGIVMMLAQLVAFAVFAGLLSGAMRWLVPLPPVHFEQRTTEPTSIAILRALRSIVAVSLAYWLMVRLVQRRKPSELAPAKLLPHAAIGWVVGMAILVAAALAMAAFGVMHWDGGINRDAALLGPLFALGLVPGITEEIMFRGVLFGVVERAFGTWSSLLVSALFFGAAHYSNPNSSAWAATAIAVEAGLLLGMAYVYTRSLWFVMGLHAAWNFTQGPLLGIPVSGVAANGLLTARPSGPELLSGGAFGAEASVITVLLCLAVAAWFTKKAIADGKLVRASWNRPRYPAAAPSPD